VTSGAVVLGIVNGFVIGLLAVGIVLIYKANKFLNLAHALFGALSALLMAKLVIEYHWNWWLACVVSIPLGTVLAVAVYRLLIRRLQSKTKSSAVLLLGSIAATQLLAGLAIIPALSPDVHDLIKAGGFPLPFDAHVKIGGVILYSDSILILVTVPVL